MKGPAVPGIVRVTVIGCLFLVQLSEYFAYIFVLGFLSRVLFHGVVIH